MSLLTPSAVVVVVLDLAGRQIENCGVSPVWQLHTETDNFAAEQAMRSVDRRRQTKAIASSTNRVGVFDLGLI